MIVCFSLTDKTSLKNVKAYWNPEIDTYLGNTVPRILVGLKSDLRDEYILDSYHAELCPTREEAEAVCKDLNYRAYIECSALKRENLS